MVTYSPLPRLGDKVSIHSLHANGETELNGQTGTVKKFFLDKGAKYEIQLRRSTNKTKSSTFMASLSNIRVEEESITSAVSDDADQKAHVLIPCHVDSDRRACLFLRCAQSVSEQQTTSDFRVFVALSGPKKDRESMLNVVMALSSQKQNSRWYVQETGLEERPQMEHIRYLVDLSASVDPDAQLLFIDNDDMMHPLRIVVFLEGRKHLGIPKECPFPLKGKLLLRENISATEGQMGRLIAATQDFDFWKIDPDLKGKVEWASNSRCEEMDAEEYFDFMVPTAVMQKFFRLNPPNATSSKYCDLRLLAILDKLAPIEVADMPQYPWLLAHYKASDDNKRKMFDSHGKLSGKHAADQASMNIYKPSDKDKKLAQRFPLSKNQVAICRSHLESIIIQYIGWDSKACARARKDKIKELNSLYGAKFGDELWSQVEAKVESYFNKSALEESEGAWECLLKQEGYSCIIN